MLKEASLESSLCPLLYQINLWKKALTFLNELAQGPKSAYRIGKVPTEAVHVTRARPPASSFELKVKGSILGGSEKGLWVNTIYLLRAFHIITEDVDCDLLLGCPTSLIHRARVGSCIRWNDILEQQSSIAEHDLPLIERQLFVWNGKIGLFTDTKCITTWRKRLWFCF